MKFTKKEISLCKQVTKKHRRGVEFGDWYWNGKIVCLMLSHDYISQEWVTKHWISLWTISDCLEFLGKKYGSSIDLYRNDKVLGGQWLCKIAGRVWSGKTPLEACLRAVLAVLEEK